jgi:hypothetical protein
VLAPVAAYAADSDTDRSKPAAFAKDSVITTKINTKRVWYLRLSVGLMLPISIMLNDSLAT